MYSLLKNVEFFVYANEVCYRRGGGTVQQLSERDYDFVDALVARIAAFYPKAYEALCREYARSEPNVGYFRFLIASRFIRCNFGRIDETPDISADLTMNFEYVGCPLRGICNLECVVCRPEFNHNLSDAELRVMRLWYQGEPEAAIAEALFISPCTVHNHVANSYRRLGLHSRSEFVAYATKNHLFDESK